MTDREKVIKESEEAIDILAKAEEPTFWLDFVRCAFENALALLKDQEPRVMTLEETKAFGWDYCYLEELRLPGKEYRAVCGDYTLTCITWPCTTSMRIQHGDGNYNKTWRCWTEKPTEEQRRAVKWDG